MNEKLKKILLIIGFISFVFVIAYLLWTLFIKQESVFIAEEVNNQQNQSIEGLQESGPGEVPVINKEQGEEQAEEPSQEQTSPQEAQIIINENMGDEFAIGGLTQTSTIVKSKTLDPNFNKTNNSIQFYNQEDGLFYKIDENGNLVKLDEQKFDNVESVEWSPLNNKAIIEFSDKTKTIYDFDKKNKVSLPSHFENFAFSNNGNKLVGKSIANDPENRWLVVSNNDGSQMKQIEKIEGASSSIIPYWSPNSQSIAMQVKNIGINKQEIFFIGEYGVNPISIVVDGQNFQPLWSERGDKMLYSTNSIDNNLKPNLWIINASGNEIGTGKQNLNIETWAEKCTFANNAEVYCAVPKTTNPGQINPPQLSLDNLYKININTGQKTLIAIPDQNHNISSIMVNKDQTSLFFSDNNGKIHSINLK